MFRFWQRLLSKRAFWIVAVSLIAIASLHYFTPQLRSLSSPIGAFFNRHAVERILFLFPIAYASFVFGQSGALVVLAFSTLAMLPRAIWISPYPADALLETCSTVVVGWLVVWMIEAQAREKALRQRLYEKMRFYAQQVTQAQENERKRIARELHDETIQVLIAVSRHLEAAAAPGEKEEGVSKRLQVAQGLMRDAIASMRRFVRNLRPPTLDHLGLVAAVEGLARTVDGLVVEVEVRGEIRRLPAEHELALFRIVQEGLNNAQRHAEASRAGVCIEFGTDVVRVTISDDWRGFVVPLDVQDLVAGGQLGLAGMQERARGAGGTLVVRSASGQGTEVRAELAVPEGMEGA